ncbi:MAG: hypothetical protein KC584_18615, partial [Nitrospira sp.]|nr:hypothetical protein [Nitrospira sp.]
LKCGDDGKVGFEFEARKPKTGEDRAASGKKLPAKKAETKKPSTKKPVTKKPTPKAKKLKPG